MGSHAIIALSKCFVSGLERRATVGIAGVAMPWMGAAISHAGDILKIGKPIPGKPFNNSVPIRIGCKGILPNRPTGKKA